MTSPAQETEPRRSQFCGRTRRELLHEVGGGFLSVVLSGLLGDDFFQRGRLHAANSALPDVNPHAPKMPHWPAKARSVIFLFMYGGPSHVDTFDYKPRLYPLDGKTIQVKTFGRGGHRNEGRVVGPKWQFKPYGRCGKMISDLFPHIGTCADEIGFVHSMSADSPIHGSAMLNMNSGRLQSGHPCLGSWVSYGLGTSNENLPAFVVMLDRKGGPISGAKNWSSGYMPATFQGVQLRSVGAPILDLAPSEGMTPSAQRRLINGINAYNLDHAASRPGNSDLAARIASLELAFNMQKHAPEAVDLSRESDRTRELYGIGSPRTEDFGRKCLLARRLVERGVRFIQIYSGGGHNDDNWDAHTDIVANHTHHAGSTDLPIAGLIKDLKERGLLESTLIVWGGEFGRQPTAEYAQGTGRDHNAYGFTLWMAGGGVKGGTSVGATDELGSVAVESRFHVKNLHATVLALMGLDPNRLTYFFGGLEQKLVGVEGADPIRAII